MKVTFLGHAGLLIEAGGLRIACDPWFSPEGAFLGAWHQFPPNAHVDQAAVRAADYLFLSHNHQDHFDERFLRSWSNPRTRVLIADYVSPHFLEMVEGLAIGEVVVARDWEPLELAPRVRATVVRDPTLYKTDSALHLDAEGDTILNLNDCHLSGEPLCRLASLGCHALFAQYSGASWYPEAYIYPEPRRLEITRRNREKNLDLFADKARVTSAPHVFPVAGPPCFIDPHQFHLNFRETVFFDARDAVVEMESRIGRPVNVLSPGDSFEMKGATLTWLERRSFDWTTRRATLERLQEERLPRIESVLAAMPSPGGNLAERLKGALVARFNRNRRLAADVNGSVAFRVTGELEATIVIRSDKTGVAGDVFAAPPPGVGYVFTMDARIANGLAEEYLEWEDVFLSMRFEARREPDVYNWPMMAILQFGRDTALLRCVEQALYVGPGDRTVVSAEDRRSWTIQRYCPHAGQDLTGIAVDKRGCITCPRHGWQFDLNDRGKCIEGGNIPLRIYEQNI
ncbi:MAG TPA: MBL fold metallo-hydrolase [Methylomirabilota bacterium]|nr:MBL fold metallo-hydrolase [Methylomirabilota bacterium]